MCGPGVTLSQRRAVCSSMFESPPAALRARADPTAFPPHPLWGQAGMHTSAAGGEGVPGTGTLTTYGKRFPN
jgi:hypothetical protein